MQALFSVMRETAQQSVTDFRRLCLEAEKKNEIDAAPVVEGDDGQQPSDPYADEIKKLEAKYGPLIEGYGLCGGYSDAMSIFLDYYNIPNFKIISENHAWNAVKINNKWYHLDLTWDDPITTSGKDVLKHDYFLINTQKLYELESIQHNFDKEVFKEIAN